MKKRIPERKTFSLQPSTFSLSGFTLIEVLVALIILTIVVAVALESQLHALKAEQKARALQIFRFETQRIFSATHRIKNEQELMELPFTDNVCRVKSEPVQLEAGTNIQAVIKYELKTEGLPSFTSVFFTRVPDFSRRRPDAVGGPMKAKTPDVRPSFQPAGQTVKN